MLFFIEIAIVVGLTLLEILLVVGSGLVTAFLTRINFIDSLIAGFLGGTMIPVFLRDHFEITLHPVFWIAIGILILVISYIILSTKIGFWIFSLIFSAFWAFIPAFLVHYYIKDNLWTIGTAVGVFIISMTCHITSRTRIDSGSNNAQTS